MLNNEYIKTFIGILLCSLGVCFSIEFFFSYYNRFLTEVFNVITVIDLLKSIFVVVPLFIFSTILVFIISAFMIMIGLALTGILNSGVEKYDK